MSILTSIIILFGVAVVASCVGFYKLMITEYFNYFIDLQQNLLKQEKEDKEKSGLTDFYEKNLVPDVELFNKFRYKVLKSILYYGWSFPLMAMSNKFIKEMKELVAFECALHHDIMVNRYIDNAFKDILIEEIAKELYKEKETKE